MTILDTFYLLFKADTTDLKKGQSVADESFKKLQEKVKSTNSDTQDLGVSFLDLATQAAAALGIVVSVGAAVKSIFSAEQTAQTLGLFSQTTGLAVGQVDALTQAVIRFGGTREGALKTLDLLQQGLTFQTPYGAAGDNTFQPTPFSLKAAQYGIEVHPGQKPSDILEEVHRMFQGRAANLNEKQGLDLGFDLGTIRLLQQGGEEYQKLLKHINDIGTESDKDAQSVFEFNQKWADFSQQLGVFERAIGGPILDFLSAFYKDMDEVGKAALIAGTGVLALGAALESAGIITAIAPVAVLAAGFFSLAGAVIAATWPFLLFAAALVVAWTLIHYGPQILNYLSGAFSAFFSKLEGWGKDAINIFKDMFGWIGKTVKAVEDFSVGGYEKLKSSLGFGPHPALSSARGAINGAASSLLSRGGVVGSNSSSSSVQIGSVVVHTQATDADGIASAIGGNLQKHINFAINNFNTSVLA